MATMSPERATTAPASPGLDAAWAHPVLGRMLRGRSHRRRLDQRHPWVLDSAVVLAVAFISLPDLLSPGTHGPFGDTTGRGGLPLPVLAAFSAVMIVPLWWRRRAPEVTYFVIASVSLLQWSLGVWQQSGIGALVALYTVAAYGSLRVLGWAVALTVTELTLAVCLLVPVEHPFLGLFFMLGTATAAVATGLTLRIRRLYLGALEEHAARLEVERDQRAQLTAAAERSRVAREMHDILGHNLSVMVSLADGAAVLAGSRGESSAEALRVLGDTGRQAMGELRRVLGVLGKDEDGTRMLEPQPGVRDLDALFTRVRAAGLTVTYRTVGDLGALDSGVQLTVYRVVQESLTNTLKHAGPGADAEVTVTAEAAGVRVRIVDDGGTPGTATAAPGADGPPGDGSGHGLVGIRQRAALYGGAVTIGPRSAGRGWAVDVVLDTPSPGDQLP